MTGLYSKIIGDGHSTLQVETTAAVIDLYAILLFLPDSIGGVNSAQLTIAFLGKYGNIQCSRAVNIPGCITGCGDAYYGNKK